LPNLGLTVGDAFDPVRFAVRYRVARRPRGPRNAKISSMPSAPAPSPRARLTVGVGVSLLLVLGLLIFVWQAGLLRPGCSAYLQSRQEVGWLPPGASMLREDLTGDGHGAVALSGGDPSAFLISSPPLGPAYARWDFTMPSVDQKTTGDVVEFYGSRLAAHGWTTAPDSMPNDWTWQQGDVSFRLDAPQSKGERAQSLVSWTRSWEITETIAGPGGAQPPECNWDGKETSSGHVA